MILWQTHLYFVIVVHACLKIFYICCILFQEFDPFYGSCSGPRTMKRSKLKRHLIDLKTGSASKHIFLLSSVVSWGSLRQKSIVVVCCKKMIVQYIKKAQTGLQKNLIKAEHDSNFCFKGRVFGFNQEANECLKLLCISFKAHTRPSIKIVTLATNFPPANWALDQGSTKVLFFL